MTDDQELLKDACAAEWQERCKKTDAAMASFEQAIKNRDRAFDRDRSYLTFMSDMITCVAFAAAAAYALRNPKLFWDNSWLAAVIGIILYLTAVVGSVNAASQFAAALFFQDNQVASRRWAFAFFLAVLSLSGYFATTAISFAKPG